MAPMGSTSGDPSPPPGRHPRPSGARIHCSTVPDAAFTPHPSLRGPLAADAAPPRARGRRGDPRPRVAPARRRRPRAGRRCSPARWSRWSSSAPPRARGCRSPAASPGWAARSSCSRRATCSSAAARPIEDTAKVLGRMVDAIMLRTGPARHPRGARPPRGRAGHQRPHLRAPPLPGAGRRPDAARALRRPRRACRSPTSATATTAASRS